MRLLILTQYFPPETGAPQNRLYELAIRLQKEGFEIEVLTAMPNYPQMEIFPEYRGKKKMMEEMDGMKIHRASIYVTQKRGIVSRLRNYFSFVRSSYVVGKNLDNFDFILCESPPLFLGYSAMRLAKRLKAKLIFNVSDLWPESAEKMGIVTNKMLLGRAYKLEAKIYRRSFLITGQTQGIVANIKERFPTKEVYWLPNGVDLKRYVPDEIEPAGFREKYGIRNDQMLLFYGGIIGHAQGLEIILHAAEKFKQDDSIRFVLMGSGPVKDDLIALSKELELNNVIFSEPVARTEIGGVLKEIDASIIPLRKLDLFLGAIPSKIFEVLAMEKPILLGVAGEAKELFIDEGKSGWAFEPENVDSLVQSIREMLQNKNHLIEYGQNGRRYVAEKFNRDKIAADFCALLKSKSS